MDLVFANNIADINLHYFKDFEINWEISKKNNKTLQLKKKTDFGSPTQSLLSSPSQSLLEILIDENGNYILNESSNIIDLLKYNKSDISSIYDLSSHYTINRLNYSLYLFYRVGDSTLMQISDLLDKLQSSAFFKVNEDEKSIIREGNLKETYDMVYKKKKDILDTLYNGKSSNTLFDNNKIAIKQIIKNYKSSDHIYSQTGIDNKNIFNDYKVDYLFFASFKTMLDSISNRNTKYTLLTETIKEEFNSLFSGLEIFNQGVTIKLNIPYNETINVHIYDDTEFRYDYMLHNSATINTSNDYIKKVNNKFVFGLPFDFVKSIIDKYISNQSELNIEILLLISYTDGTYSELRDKYYFNNILDEEDSLTILNDDHTFIAYNKENIVVSLRTISTNNKIGNAYTLRNYMMKGLSKIIAKKISEYINENNMLCYVFTKFDHIKKMWKDTGVFYLVEDNNSNKWNGTFVGLNDVEYTNLDNMYVLRNNNCRTLYIFHNANSATLDTRREEAIKDLGNVIPRHNIKEIDFVANDKSYDHNHFFNIINKEYNEITYKILIMMGHGLYNNRFTFGGDTGKTIEGNKLINDLDSTQNFFIFMACCYSNHFINKLEEMKRTTISGISLHSLSGGEGCSFAPLNVSLKFISEFTNNPQQYTVEEAFQRIKGNQLKIAMNSEPHPILQLFGFFIETLPNVDHILAKRENQMFLLNLAIAVTNDTNIFLNNQHIQRILTNVNTNEQFNTIKSYISNKSYDLDHFKTEFEKFFNFTHDRGVTDSKLYLSKNLKQMTNSKELFCAKSY